MFEACYIVDAMSFGVLERLFTPAFYITKLDKRCNRSQMVKGRLDSVSPFDQISRVFVYVLIRAHYIQRALAVLLYSY